MQIYRPQSSLRITASLMSFGARLVKMHHYQSCRHHLQGSRGCGFHFILFCKCYELREEEPGLLLKDVLRELE